jgi:electron transfer flavoprotein alpha subunit
MRPLSDETIVPESDQVTELPPLRIACLVKQVPRFDAMQLGPDGRLVRSGLELEMNPYCRRAVATGTMLAKQTSGRCTVFSLGPPSADDILREAVAWGADDGVLISDPAFAGSDTLATAKALAAALRHEGPFDLVLVGRNSVDADTGQVGPQLAELLDIAFIGGARTLTVDHGLVQARLEHDDGWCTIEARLPALISCAERLCEPCKVDAAGRADVPAERIRRLSAADLGRGPWGQSASPTSVGEVKLHRHERDRRVLAGPLEDQVAELVASLRQRGLVGESEQRGSAAVEVSPTAAAQAGGGITVVLEPGRKEVAREQLGAAAAIGYATGRGVVAVVPSPCADLATLSSWGADHVVLLEGSREADDVSAALATWCGRAAPWAVLVPSTMWGRETAGRLAARLDAGLTGDAIGFEVVDDRLVAWKPAFGGQLVAAITATSPIQLATVRPGVFPLLQPRAGAVPSVETLRADRRDRVIVHARGHDDDIEILANARRVIGVGAGVDPSRYDEIDELAEMIGGVRAATRQVTDHEWMPRSRQVGVTGRSIAPELYVAVGISGKFNHTIGVRGAGTIVAINSDADAPIFEQCDIGVVADWTVVVPLILTALRRELATAADAG